MLTCVRGGLHQGACEGRGGGRVRIYYGGYVLSVNIGTGIRKEVTAVHDVMRI